MSHDLAVGEKEPRIAPGAFVATSAVLIGEVTLEDGAVLTGTVETPLTVGAGVSVGHAAILSGCRVEEGTLIAIRAAVLEGASVGAEAIVGAGAVVPPGGDVPPRTLVLGNPAAPKRAVTEEEVAENRRRVERYAALAQSYRTAAHTPAEGSAD